MACALRREGTVSCWGDLLQGGPWSWALGRISPAGDAPTDVPGVGSVQQLAAGHRFSCALRRDGSVVCWGINESAIAGAGVADPPVIAPRVIAGLSLR